jgi:hypothetical protein
VGLTNHRLHESLIKKFDASQRHPRLHRRANGRDARLHTGKRAYGGRHRFRNAVQLDRYFGDDAERPFRTDEQTRQIVTGRGFAGARSGADDPSIGQHHPER